MTTWQRETERYKERVSQLGETLNEFANLVVDLPHAPLPVRLSDEAAIRYQICILLIGTFRSAQQLTGSIYLLWLTGQYLAASLLVRLLLEHQGVVAYTQAKVFDALVSGAEIATCQKRLSRLLLGSKSGVRSPWGGTEEIRPINVMDFLREADQRENDVLDNYNYLCDASHPSYLQHSYLLFAGEKYDNWGNKLFAQEAHGILERTLSIAEKAVAALTRDGTALFSACLPMICAELLR